MSHEPLINEDPVLPLNPDSQELAARHINETYHALQTVMQGVAGKLPLTEELAKNCISIMEFRLRDLCSALGVETQGAAEVNNRHAKLRAANMRIHELEGQLGQSQAPELTQMSVKRLHEVLNEWWDFEGFGHLSSVEFGPYGVEVKLSCHLFGVNRPSSSDTPVSAREAQAQWYADLAKRGFQLKSDPKEREAHLADSDQNRQLLCDLVQRRLPSAHVHGFVSTGRTGMLQLRECQVFIRNYQDILSLPVAPAAPDASATHD